MVKLKALQAHNFSRVQVGVPLSSKRPNVSNKQSELSFQLFFARTSPNQNLNSSQSIQYIL